MKGRLNHIIAQQRSAELEAAAQAVAADIAARLHGGQPSAPYQGSGTGDIEFGGGLVGKIEANFIGGPAPTARIIASPRELAAEKEAFVARRRDCWFGLDAHAVPVGLTNSPCSLLTAEVG